MDVYDATAREGYHQVPPNEQPGSTVGGSTFTILDRVDDPVTDPALFSVIYSLAFPASLPEDRDSSRYLETFTGRICLSQLRSSPVAKRQLLTGAETTTDLATAQFALSGPTQLAEPSEDRTMADFQAQVQRMVRAFHDWCRPWYVPPPAGLSPELAATTLYNQAVAALGLDRTAWVYVLLHVFGDIPELWTSRSSPDNSEAIPWEVVDSRHGKGKDEAPQPFDSGTSNSQHAPAAPTTQSIPLAPQHPAAIPTRVSTFDINTMNTTGAPFPPNPTTYHPPTAAGASQPQPALSWGHGGPSAAQPPPPDDWQQSQFSHRQPAPPVTPEASVQDASRSMFHQSFHAHPSNATGDRVPLPSFGPFDLSTISDELQAAQEEFPLSEMGDLGQATALLQRTWGVRGFTDGHASAAGSHGPTLLPQLTQEHKQLKLSEIAKIYEAARYMGQWHTWMLEFQDSCEFRGLQLPQNFQPQMDKMVEVRNFLALLVIYMTGQFKKPQPTPH